MMVSFMPFEKSDKMYTSK
jgi:hypothetical protein